MRLTREQREGADMVTIRPEDFASYEEALAYANTRLDEINEALRELEHDMVFLSEGATTKETEHVAERWIVKVSKLQGATQ